MTTRNLVGIYEMVKVESGPTYDSMTEQPFDMGVVAFGANGVMSLNQRSEGHPLFSYLAGYRVEGDELLIDTRVCSVVELEGKPQRRRIELHDAERLVLSAVGVTSGKAFRISWRRVGD